VELNISDDILQQIEENIARAEKNTSAEIRVHLEDECADAALDRAAYVFAALEMHKTALRNGVLIYLATVNRKAAIIGDKGIHEKVGNDYWQRILDRMLNQFKSGAFAAGLEEAIASVGQQLSIHFPIQHDDTNELSNKVTHAQDIH
jgi:uncharacterized membrane protein